MFLPSKHGDLRQNFAVLWRLEWELDFWLGKPSPTPNNSSALGRHFPFAHLAKMPDTEPLVLAARVTYSVLQDEQQLCAAPKELKVTVQDWRFIECFQQLHWLQCRQECLCPRASSSCFFSEEMYEMVSKHWTQCQNW